MEKRVLRVLYTVNHSPQYILARSPCPVTVTLLRPTDGQHSGGIGYASVSLKSCIETICTTSPELLQSDTRDFSVYVLDPLESENAPGPVNIPSEAEGSKVTEGQVRGVAVGLGLMSWALAAEGEEALVNGTLTRTGSGQEALEVVFALRETTRIEKASFPAVIQSWNKKSAKAQGKQPEVDTAATIATILNRPKKPRVTKNTDTLQSLPESERIYRSSSVYIGPPKKKPSNSATFARAFSTPAPASTFPPTLAAVHTGTTASSSTAKPILAPSISTLPAIPVSTAPTPGPSTASSPSVIKKKKTKRRNQSPDQPLYTRTTLFKRTVSEPLPGPTALPQTPSLTDIFSQLASTPANSTQNAALLATINAIDSGKGIDNNPALVQALQDLVTAWQVAPPPEPGRMAPLQPSNHRIPSDDDAVVIDKENVNPSPFRRRVGQDVKDSKPSQTSVVSHRASLGGHLPTDENLRPTPSAIEANGGYISRKRTLDEFMEDRESQSERHRRPSYNLIPFSSPPRPRLSHTEPGGSRGRPIFIPDSPQGPKIAASSPVRDGTQSTARRKYVVPDWARTDTAMQPRLSEEARRVLKEAEDKKEAEREEKRRLERERRRTGRPQGRQPHENAENDAPTTATDVKSSSPLRPIAAVSTDFAMLSTACEIHSLSSLLTGSRSQTPPPSQDMAPPCTPPRRDSADAPSTPFSSSLFTPLADSWKSPLVSPSTSPSYGAKGKHFSKDNDLSEELESAFEELDSLSPSSLPDSETTPITEHVSVPSDTKQFWQGLPPSSPIQPSSPLEDVDDDSDREIPIATSDAEDGDGDEEDEDTDMESRPLSSTPKESVSLPVEPPAPDENGAAVPSWQDQQPSEEMDVFDMFTNVDYGDSTTFAPEGLDLTEFMESMKPLIQNQLDVGLTEQGSFDFNWIDSGEGELDHGQLAASVQELFSGCLM